MSNSGKPISRRHVLHGAAGFTLALPFLPSLVKDAKAASARSRPRMFWLSTSHGGAWDSNMYPANPMLTNTQTPVAGHTVGSCTLKSITTGTSLSPILSAAALSQKLMGKMNVLRGLDVPFYIAHNTGMHLGNYARNDGNGTDGQAVTAIGMRPTADQIMANSPNFYSATDLASTKLRTMVINPGVRMSWGFSDPSMGVNSGVQPISGASSSVTLFKSIFGSLMSTSTTASRPSIASKVLANYNSLRQSNTRLSAADKTRLDTHIAFINQLEGQLSAKVSCDPTPTGNSDDADKHGNLSNNAADTAIEAKLWADVVVAAFTCEASRLAVFGWGETDNFSSYTGSSWHQGVAHQWNTTGQPFLKESYQNFFEKMLVYVATQLDAQVDSDGNTVLDNSLIGWSQECAMSTHDSYSIPTITFGSAGGWLNTGLYCDYRKSNDNPLTYPFGDKTYSTSMGLLYSQWLATMLQSMGCTPSEFELWKNPDGSTQHGFGTSFVTSLGWPPPYAQHYQSVTSPYFQMASQPLPFLKAGG
jgi:hypothetical protein